ncbi:MAG: HU family DNA-binding protein [Prevotellaceae bacterium]|nr:HU family DNA-binding protein [Prevotellaceae bacterium]
MLTYHVIRRKNIKTGDILYYPQLVTAAADDRAKIIERIEKKCTLASADVKAVVDALEVEIIDCLQQGRSIRLGDLGSFRPSLRCGKGVKEEQSVSPAMIKRVHIVFHPSSRIRRALSVKDHAVSFYRRDKKKKGDGTNQPGTTPPGTNPAGTGGAPSGTGGNPSGTGGSPSGTPTPGGTPVATGGTAVPAPVGTGGTAVPAPVGTGGVPSGTGGNPSGTPTPGGTPVATGGTPSGTGGNPSGTPTPGGTAVPAPGGMPTVAPAGH